MHIVILTYSMVQSPSWEAKWFAASQEVPRILRNPKVHYRTHKPLQLVPILGQSNPVHTHLLEIIPNNIHPSTPRSPQWSLSLRFPHQGPIMHIIMLNINRQQLQFGNFVTSLAWRVTVNALEFIRKISGLGVQRSSMCSSRHSIPPHLSHFMFRNSVQRRKVKEDNPCP